MKSNAKQQLIEQYPLNWSEAKIQSFREQLLGWYDQHQRDLPWRRTDNPYYIWASEIMLQQTQVDTVKPYYERFIETLPTIEALATASEAELLSLWQGLGYYSRVRNMQVAAQQVMSDYDGQMPKTIEGLLSLKGIGPYTAGAVGSIAFGLVEPAIDGNVMRIMSRLFEIDQDITLTSTRKLMAAYLYQLIDPERPGDFNQALMDIGATIMTPTNYEPLESPLLDFDQSYHNGTAHLFPIKAKKVKVIPQMKFAYAIRNIEGEYLVRQHTEDELLHGLWHFPMADVEMVMEGVTQHELLEPLLDQYPEITESLLRQAQLIQFNGDQLQAPTIIHQFSHRKWTVTLVEVALNNSAISNFESLKWASMAQMTELPLSTLQQKLMQQIKS